MKKLVVLFLALILSSSTLLANDNNPIEKAKDQLRTEIVKLLGNNEFPLTNAEIAKAELSILLNNNNQLVIVSVKSDNQLLTAYIKRKLNYKRIKSKSLKRMKIYRMPVKIVKA